MGTVTFLFTDIEGSTSLARELGERWPDVLAEHRQALRDVFDRHGGAEVDTQGDAGRRRGRARGRRRRDSAAGGERQAED